VYSESLLDHAATPDDGGALTDSGRGNLTAVQGGRAATGGTGSTGAEAAQQGGEGAGEPNEAGTASGGTGATSSGAGQGGSGGTGGSAAIAGTGTGGSTSPPSGVDMLDDMEDGNFYLSPKPPRYGYWYVAGDTTVGAKLPKIEQLVGALEPARDLSTSAVHFVASGFKGWGSSVGLSFTNASSVRGAYDAGSAVGISFWVRGSVADNAKLRVLFPLVGSDPSGKLCGGSGQGQCLDHFATQVSVTTEWQAVSIPFSSLHQAGWGVPLAGFDPTQMLGIEWSAGIADVDVWIDDLALLRP
jgi:hypothetical protein